MNDIKNSIVANNHSKIIKAKIDKSSNEYQIMRKSYIKGFISGVLASITATVIIYIIKMVCKMNF